MTKEHFKHLADWFATSPLAVDSTAEGDHVWVMDHTRDGVLNCFPISDVAQHDPELARMLEARRELSVSIHEHVKGKMSPRG